MAEETVVAATSAAVEAPAFTHFDGWDEDGTPVVTKKRGAVHEDKRDKQDKQETPEEADSAAADASKEAKPDDAADSAAKKTQESRRKPGAEARINELTAERNRLKAELEEARKPKASKTEAETKAESSTARQDEPKAEKKAATPDRVPGTRPRPSLDDKDADGKSKYGSYEDFSEDLVGWKAEQIIAERELARRSQQQQEALGKQLEEARGRYTDFDSVTKPLVNELFKPEMPRAVLEVINDSPVLADLLYAIGGTKATTDNFLETCRTNPGKALRVALLMEQEIVKELDKGGAGGKQEAKVEASPATPKPRAPKPPAEVGGRGAPEEDARIAAAKSGDFRSFEAEQFRRAKAALR